MLTNFVIKLAWKVLEGVNEQRKSAWVLYFDGSFNRSRGGVSVILEGLEGIAMEHSLKFDFQTTNNQAKYEALIVVLNLVKDMSVKSLTTRSNSLLVIGQIKKMYETKVPCLNKYLEKIKAFLGKFNHFELKGSHK